MASIFYYNYIESLDIFEENFYFYDIETPSTWIWYIPHKFGTSLTFFGGRFFYLFGCTAS